MIDKILSFIKTTLIRIIYRKDRHCYNTWVFSSSFNSKYNYNSKYLFEYIIENEPEITPLFVINDKKKREELIDKYGEKYFIETKSFKGLKKVLKSGVWLTSAGLPCYGVKLNKKRLIINLWHGVPIKKIALMEENISIFKKLYFKLLFSNNYSYIVTTSKELIPIMSKSFGVDNNKIKVLGQPRNDALQNNNNEKTLEKLYTHLPDYKSTLLYAPTYRDNKNTHFFPFKDFSQNKLNEFLEEKKAIIFIRSHQSETEHIKKQKYGNRVRLINDDLVEDIMDILNVFDLVITDYSSIYIDYLITGKPIIFLPYDKEFYSKSRGFNFDYDKFTPGPKPKDLSEFMIEVDRLLNNEEYYLTERKTVNTYFNEIAVNSSKKVINFVKSKIK